MKQKFKLVAIAVVLAAQGCATTQDGAGIVESFGKKVHDTFNNDDPCAHSKRHVGMAVGALVGAAIGSQLAGDTTRMMGAALGALAGGGIGALIGNELDSRACEISKIQKKYHANIQVTPLAAQPVASAAPTGASPTVPSSSQAASARSSSSNPVGLSVNVQDSDGKPQFAPGSPSIQPVARSMFGEIARTYVPASNDTSAVELANRRRVLLIGHTDDTGSSKLNAELSERRAMEVAKIFRSAGMSDDQIFYQGAGETMPIASNDTLDGSAKNRRVEIVDLSDDGTFQTYLDNRRPLTSYYRASPDNRKVVLAPNEQMDERTKNKVRTPKAKTDKPDAVVAVAQTEQKTAVATYGIDFGGRPFTRSGKVIDVGSLNTGKSRGFSIINEAHADAGPILTCDLDRPRYSGAVKSLKTGQEYKTNQYLPGAYNSSWAGMVNGNLLALTHVAVLRDGAAPVGSPEILIYKDYKSPNDQPTFRGQGTVNAYRGDKALLYRVFSGGPVKCIDVMIPVANAADASGSEILYDRGKTLYWAPYKAKIAKY